MTFCQPNRSHPLLWNAIISLSASLPSSVWAPSESQGLLFELLSLLRLLLPIPAFLSFSGHFGNQHNAFRGVYMMEMKQREKGKDDLSSVKYCLSSRKGSSQKSLMLVTIFHETSMKKILHQENIEYGLHRVGIHLVSLQVRCLVHICHVCSFGRRDAGTSGK